MATGYGLDGSVMESRWQREFSCSPDQLRRPTKLLVQWIPGLSSGVKRSERVADHPLPSRVKVANMLGLYLRLPLCLHRHVMGDLYLQPYTFIYLAFIYLFFNEIVRDSSGIAC